MPIKSFRGKIAMGSSDTIVLHTNNGSTGYRIKKLQIISEAPGTGNNEYVCKVFSIDPNVTAVSPATATVDFADNTLLAVAYYTDNSSSAGNPPGDIIIFDNITFNQDIYVTMQDATGNTIDCNYYIELEQIKLDLNENTVATLKDIRNIEAQSV